MNIIGDCDAEYDALMDLVAKMPKDPEGFVFVGDFIDRGPDAARVVDWVKKNARAIMGNHEHMMIDYVDKTRIYTPTNWTSQGGKQTLDSYKGDEKKIREHVDWMKGLPKYIENDDYLISHAPIAGHIKEKDFARESESTNFVWNRQSENPVSRRSKIQVYGHESQVEVDSDNLAICIDNSKSNSVNGFSTITHQMYHAPFRVSRYPNWDHPTREGFASFSDDQLAALNKKMTPAIRDFLAKKKTKFDLTNLSKRDI